MNLKNRYKNLVYLCFPEYELIFKKKTIYSDLALSFIEKYPHADIISNARIDTLQNFFKKNGFRHWKKKPATIKEYAINSYPSVSKDDEITSSLSQLARLINTYQKEIETIKYKIIFLGKTKYFESINSIFGIGEFTASLIISEIKDKINFIDENKSKYDVRTLCKILNIHHSVYYYHCNHREENRYQKANSELDIKIIKIYQESKCRYGSPKITKVLTNEGIKVS